MDIQNNQLQFRRCELIGGGTYGKVYKCEIKDNKGNVSYGAEKLVTYKIPHSGFGILKEIHMLYLLSSECCNFFPRMINISFSDYERKPLDLEIEKYESVVFITEHIEMCGMTYFKNRNYNLDTAIDLISQLLMAVGYIHRKFITHRDIKPSNILISLKSGKPILKICDFGLSQYLVDSQPSTPDVNTIWYRAPEVCWSIKSYGDATDIWCVGATIYEILTGVPLFYGCENKNESLFAEMLNKIPCRWTKEIHSLYNKESNVVLKINGTVEYTEIRPPIQFYERFITSPYFTHYESPKWELLSRFLSKIFDFNYKKRPKAWELLNDDVFNSIKHNIINTLEPLRGPIYNENIVINIESNLNTRKMFFLYTLLDGGRFSVNSHRKLFHAVNLVNLILQRDISFFDEERNVEKIICGCIYFYEKFFSTLVVPHPMQDYFQFVDNFYLHGSKKVLDMEKYYKYDEWVYNFEKKIICDIFPTFNIYSTGIFESADYYKIILNPDQSLRILKRFIDIEDWKGGSFRSMFRHIYKNEIDPNFNFTKNN